MGSIDGTLLLHVGESSVLVQIDFTDRHEIADDSEIILGTPTVVIFDEDGVSSTNLTVASIALDATSKIVKFRITDVDTTAGESYELKCTVVLSGGATIVECLMVSMEPC